MRLPLVVLLPFLGAFLVMLVRRSGHAARHAATWSAGLVALAAAGLRASQAIPVFSGATPPDAALVPRPAWIPDAGLNLAFRLDSLVLLGIHLGSALYVEAALLIALMDFVGTVALRKYLLRGDIIE